MSTFCTYLRNIIFLTLFTTFSNFVIVWYGASCYLPSDRRYNHKIIDDGSLEGPPSCKIKVIISFLSLFAFGPG